MKSLLKFTVLVALIIGGKLSKAPQNVPLATAPKSLNANPAVLVNQRQAYPANAARRNQSDPGRAQVLNVFFK